MTHCIHGHGWLNIDGSCSTCSECSQEWYDGVESECIKGSKCGFRMMQQLHRAEMEYDAAVNAYHEAEEECRSSFYEHNQASYWKGRRDALRVFLPNTQISGGNPSAASPVPTP